MVLLVDGRSSPAHGGQDSLEAMRALFTEAQRRAGRKSRGLSRRMHDQLIQQLTAASIELALARRASSPFVTKDIDGNFALVSTLLDQVMEQTRAIRAALHPDSLECFGLTAALQGLVRDRQQSTGWKVTSTLQESALEPWPQEVLYRAAEELLDNAAAHAKATEVRVELAERAGRCRLEVRDNGVGLPCAPGPGGWRPGCGLGSILENVRMLGGSLEIESAPGWGTAVRVEMPKAKRTRAGR